MKKVYRIEAWKGANTSDEIIQIKGPFGYAGHSENWSVSTDIEFNNGIFDDEHFKKNVNLLYRLPNISMSRDKLAIYQDKVDFKITRDKNKADIIVISDKYVEKMTTRTWSQVINQEDALTLMALCIQIDTSHYGALHTEILNADSDSYFCVSTMWGHLKQEFESDARPIFDFIESIDTDRLYVSHFNDSSAYDWILLNEHKLIRDVDLNKLCTGDSVKLNAKDFERLEELLSSSDDDNISVALSLMSNCNMEDSKTSLALAFAFYSDNMKRNKVWNQVNFKPLRKEFDDYIYISPSNWGHAYDKLITQLVKDNALTMYASRYVANKMFIGVLQNNFSVGTKGTVFTISAEAIQLKDEYKEQLIDSKDESDVISELVRSGDNLTMADKLDLPF